MGRNGRAAHDDDGAADRVAASRALLRGVADLDVEAPVTDDWARIASLVETHGDLPLGGTDASVVALAERLGTDLVVTLDRRHFEVVRTKKKRKLRLLP